MFTPPGGELVEIDFPAPVGIDISETDFQFFLRHIRAQVSQQAGKFLKVDPAIAVHIVHVEQIFELVMLLVVQITHDGTPLTGIPFPDGTYVRS